MDLLTLAHRREQDSIVITVTGELDLCTARLHHDELLALCTSEGVRVVLELAGLTFCDAAGLSLLLQARDQVAATGGDTALAAPPRAVTRVLGLAGLTSAFAMFSSTSVAVTAPPGALRTFR